MKKKWTGDREQDLHSLREKFSTNASRFFSVSLAGGFMAACLATLLYQGYQWLFHGSWVKLPLHRFLYKVPGVGSWEWLHNPDRWLGLHSLVSFILDFGLAAFFGLLAAVSLLIGTAIKDDR